jgi:hypothetical protein
VTLPAPFGITVEVHRGERGRFGDITFVKHHEIEGCVMAPRYSTEMTENTNRIIVGFTRYGPPQEGDRKVLHDDRIRTPDGNFYDVVEEAADWQSPITGRHPGFEAALQRVT